MKYIVGLGNPGAKYETTRHNVGRMFLEAVIDASDWNMSKHGKALYAKGTLAGTPVEYLLPETFMNKSGDTVAHYVQKHGATPEEFIVLHDEIDLPFGEIKISKGRGDGGNNGIKSIIEQTGSKEFVRVRIGIAPTSFWTGKVKRPQGGGPLERFVLKPFTPAERKQLPEVFETISAVLDTLTTDGVDAAMNRFN